MRERLDHRIRRPGAGSVESFLPKEISESAAPVQALGAAMPATTTSGPTSLRGALEIALELAQE